MKTPLPPEQREQRQRSMVEVPPPVMVVLLRGYSKRSAGPRCRSRRGGDVIFIVAGSSWRSPNSHVHRKHGGDRELAVAVDAEELLASDTDGEPREGDARGGHLHAEPVQLVVVALAALVG